MLSSYLFNKWPTGNNLASCFFALFGTGTDQRTGYVKELL